MTARVAIYTDGACKGNPGPGGWGALLQFDGRERELCGGEAQTTNNRMELTAVIRALESLNRSCAIDLYTDSQYVKNGILRLDPQLEEKRLEDQRPEVGQECRSLAGTRPAGSAA